MTFHIEHFKCFESINVPLNNITVLAGSNGNGKSTVIQALLFLRQSIEKCTDLNDNIQEDERILGLNYKNNHQNIALNGEYCLSLGNSSAVLNTNYDGNSISLRLFENNQSLQFAFIADNLEPQLHLKILTLGLTTGFKSSILSKEFYYLNAERIGPRINQGFQFYEYPNAGYKGEFVAQLISEKSGLFPVEKARFFKDTSNPGLEFQVNEWLSYIMPNVKIKAKQSPETHTSQIQIENKYTQGDPKLATNLGFGISYVLPIIANGLIAKKDTYFIVENPEAHLHPSAQSKIGGFLAMVANAGVKVIVETHSDHVINGIQIAVAKKEINHADVTINFFSDSGENQPEIKTISLSEKGELSEWPKGFFDQTQIDFAHLIKLGRG
jgi:predicted ATPase